MSVGEPVHRAAVVFPGADGSESVVLDDGTVAEFGRSATCSIRFAAEPEVDRRVSRVVGRFVVANQRVFVETSDAPGRAGIEIRAEGRPPLMLMGGDAFAPSEPEFRVVIPGTDRSWVLQVTVRRDQRVAGPGDEPATQRVGLSLTPTQERVIRAYLAPLLQGRLEPATHREVGLALSYHPNYPREVLYETWAQLFRAGIPMPDVTDKRSAVTEAIRVHRLLDLRDEPGTPGG